MKKFSLRRLFLGIGALCILRSLPALAAPFGNAEVLAKLDQYQVCWTQLGKTSLDSMPLGNGDIAANVWVEENGDVLLYLAKNDAWSEFTGKSEGLLKLGRIRISLAPTPFVAGAFLQKLDLHRGLIELSDGGKESPKTVARIWIDANANILRIEIEGKTPVACTVTLEPLRTEEGQTAKHAMVASLLHPDVVVSGRKDGIVWYYRDTKDVAKNNPAVAGFSEARQDKLTFGGKIEGSGFRNESDTSLKTAPALEQEIRITALSKQTETPEEWVLDMDAVAEQQKKADAGAAWKQHVAWWEAFWTRSWIFAEGSPDAESVTQAYILQRFLTACCSRGEFPAKFNGGLFTMDQLRKTKTDGKDEVVTAGLLADAGRRRLRLDEAVFPHVSGDSRRQRFTGEAVLWI